MPLASCKKVTKFYLQNDTNTSPDTNANFKKQIRMYTCTLSKIIGSENFRSTFVCYVNK